MTVAPAGAQALPTRWNVIDSAARRRLAARPSWPPTFSVTSQGFDVNGAEDQFTYAYRSIRGDVTIIARVADPGERRSMVPGGA